ncbi:MAG: hypothetical protein NTX22_09765 [Ignavibacteriales bacterium]|nr:hypothetical protein [Ignavibacteriales bacterium]
MAGSYLLRPTLASLNIAKSLVDERQMSIQYRSGNIAFTVMIIACIVMSVYQSNKGDHSWEFFNAIVIIGLTAKALSNVFLVGNYRESGTKIIMAVGLMLVLFVSLENGFTVGGLVESLPWWGIVGVGWLSKKIPRTIGGIILMITVVLLFFILKKGFIVGQIITAVVVSIPLVTAGVSLIVGDRREEDSDGDVLA